jgi:nitrogen fixation protein FixH
MADDLFAARTQTTAAPSPPPPRKAGERELTGRMVLALILAFFAVVFAVNGVLVQKALSTFRGLETESSYQAGQLFGGEVAKAEAQDARHWQVDAKVARAADGSAVLDLIAHDASGAALAGLTASAILERPTDRRLDRALAVNDIGGGHFRGRAENVAPGQWDLVIELERRSERQFRSVNRIILK